MSDRFKIIGLGDAGVNSISNINHDLIYKFRNREEWNERKRFAKTDYSIVVCSPGGRFSSRHLQSLVEIIKTNNEKIFLVSIMPFLSESSERIERANEIFKEVSKRVDKTFLIENENFAQKYLNEKLEIFLESVNKTISHTIDVLKTHMNGLGDIRKLGFATSTGEKMNELESNLTFTNSRDNPQAIVGVIESPTKYEAIQISQIFGVEMLEYKRSFTYGIYGFTIHEGGLDSLWYPSELYIHSL